jgi:type VI secretion system secreted protein Hcp
MTMAVDMFMKIGTVKGEAQDDKHKDEIDVLGWDWGMSNSGTAHVGGGAGSGKVNVHDLTFSKPLCIASTTLQLACCKGTHYDTATLVVRKAGDNPLEYLKITMKEVFVTSIHTGCQKEYDRLTESVTLTFASVKVEYQKQGKDGKGTKGPEMSWDIAQNKSA